MIARRNLIDGLRQAARRRAREAHIAQELALEGTRPMKAGARDADAGARITALTFDPRERAALRLWLDGAPANAIAIALGLDGASGVEGARAVKRLRDRIAKRARRQRGKGNG